MSALFAILCMLLVGVVDADDDGHNCRCEAEFERFYGGRRLLEGPTSRLLHSFSHHYDYQSAYVNDDGYYVVENIVVLPRNSKHCLTNDSGQSSIVAVQNFMNMFGGGGRHLVEEAARGTEHKERPRSTSELRGTQRGKRSSSSKQNYYFYGGKGKGKGKGLGHGDIPKAKLPPLFDCPFPFSSMQTTDIPTPSPQNPIVPENVCWDGSSAPQDPENCVTLCPINGDSNDGDECVLPCSNDGSQNFVLCVDLCTGSVGDPVNCREPCCPKEPTAVPTESPRVPLTSRPQQSATFSPVNPVTEPTLAPSTAPAGSSNGQLIPTVSPDKLPTFSPVLPDTTPCPDGSPGPINPSMCLIICPLGGPYLPGSCTAACDEEGEPPAGVDFCARPCNAGSTSVPEGCVEACCSTDIIPPTEIPTSGPATTITLLPTAAPQQLIVPSVCPDGSPGPIDPSMCLIICPPDGPYLPGLCTAACNEDGEPPADLPFCVELCQVGSISVPVGCVEACCTPETMSPTATPTVNPTVPLTETPTTSPIEPPSCDDTDEPTGAPQQLIVPSVCPDGSPGPINPSMCLIICPQDGPYLPGLCTAACDEDGEPPADLPFCVELCQDGSTSVPVGCVEACCTPETMSPTATSTVNPTVLLTETPTYSPIVSPSGDGTDEPTGAPQQLIVPSVCPDGSPGPIDPSMCLIICPQDGPYLPGLCTAACDKDGEPPADLPFCVELCEMGSTSIPLGCVEACCSPETMPPTTALTINPTMLLTESPTKLPTLAPQSASSELPSALPSLVASTHPTERPSLSPSAMPVPRPTRVPITEVSIPPTLASTTAIPTGAPVANILPTCPDGSPGPKNRETCMLVCPIDGQVKPEGCLEPCNQPNAPSDCVRVCPSGMETVGTLCVEPCCLPEFTGVCEIGGLPAPKYPGRCAIICPSSTDPNAIYPLGCMFPCPSPNVDPELSGCANLCPADGSILAPNCQEPCCPELPTDFPTAAPQYAIATTCPDGSTGPIDPSSCAQICPDSGSLVPGHCTPACTASGQPPAGATACTTVCQAGFRNVPQGCTEACCPIVTESPSPAPFCPTDNRPRPVFDPLPPECQSPTSAPQSNIIGSPFRHPTVSMSTSTVPQNGILGTPNKRQSIPDNRRGKGKGKGGGYYDYGRKGKGKGRYYEPHYYYFGRSGSSSKGSHHLRKGEKSGG